MKHVLAAATVAVVLGRSLPLLACGAAPTPYYVVGQRAPSGEGAFVNAPIQVTLEEGEDGPVVDGLEPTLVLSKRGSAEPLTLRPLLAAPALVWVPLEPLEPLATYEAHYNPGYEGQPDTVWQFTTGSSAAPELTLNGKLEVTLEEGTDPVYGPLNDCGTGAQTGTVTVTKARVKLPQAMGGFAGRFGELHLTDERAFDFSAASKTAPAVNEGHLVSRPAYANLERDDELVITLPQQVEPYRPCFAFRATDARGDQAQAEPLCLDQPFPATEAATPEPSKVTDDGPRTSSSCSFAAPGGSVGGVVGLAVALGLSAWRRRALTRRDRSKNAL